MNVIYILYKLKYPTHSINISKVWLHLLKVYILRRAQSLCIMSISFWLQNTVSFKNKYNCL